MPRNIRNTRRNFARPSDTFTVTGPTSAATFANGAVTTTVTINTVSNPVGPVGTGVYTVTSTPALFNTTITNSSTSFATTIQVPLGGTTSTYTLNVADKNYNGNGKQKVLTNAVTGVPTAAFAASIVVVAGGGPGGFNYAPNSSTGMGGGGAGGYREFSSYALELATNYTVTVGAGGTATSFPGTNGSNSVFSSVTSTGGGRGGSYDSNSGTQQMAGAVGGSGGGGSVTNQIGGTQSGSGGTSISPFPFVEVYSIQGNSGGTGVFGSTINGGGGGGALTAGVSATSTVAGNGGDGRTSLIDGAIYATGGGGGSSTGTAGQGGSSNARNGAGRAGNGSGIAATANSGGGGGGCALNSNNGYNGGAGGSGIVLLRYPNTRTITIGAGLTGSTTTSGSDKITTITAGTGNVSFA